MLHDFDSTKTRLALDLLTQERPERDSARLEKWEKKIWTHTSGFIYSNASTIYLIDFKSAFISMEAFLFPFFNNIFLFFTNIELN